MSSGRVRARLGVGKVHVRGAEGVEGFQLEEGKVSGFYVRVEVTHCLRGCFARRGESA